MWVTVRSIWVKESVRNVFLGMGFRMREGRSFVWKFEFRRVARRLRCFILLSAKCVWMGTFWTLKGMFVSKYPKKIRLLVVWSILGRLNVRNVRLGGFWAWRDTNARLWRGLRKKFLKIVRMPRRVGTDVRFVILGTIWVGMTVRVVVRSFVRIARERGVWCVCRAIIWMWMGYVRILRWK